MTATATRPVPATDLAARTVAHAVPWYLYAILLGSTSVIIGVMWDISWHRTIGRDSFWTPAHLAIYLGGVVAGASSGWIVLKTTFRGTPDERAASVRFWGFRGPLGAWVCIWGAFAMLVSAPFDDWWHNAYGLDVEILSPPHSVLAAGIGAIQVGALLLALAWQNRSENVGRSRLQLLFVYAAGILVLMTAILSTEYTSRTFLHSSAAYRVACGSFPLLLVAAARASPLRWPATATAAVYTALVLLMMWILPLFPAEPKLGPIYQRVTHMVPPDFPLLLLAPALAIDWIMQRAARDRDGRLAVEIGISFFTVFLVVQWFFADFLMTPYAQNWFFAADNFGYSTSPNSYTFRRLFYPRDATEASVRVGLGIAALLAVVSARVGLWWGNWMLRVRR